MKTEDKLALKIAILFLTTVILTTIGCIELFDLWRLF